MSPPSYAQNKQHAINYRLKNLEKVRQTCNDSNKRKYQYKLICKIHRNILLENVIE